MTKLNIELNLSDIFIESEEEVGNSLSDSIRSSILYEATNQVRKMVDEQVSKLVVQSIHEKLDLIIPAMVQARLESIHLSEKFKGVYGSEMTLSDMIISKFQQTNFDRKMIEYVEATSKKYAEEIKKSYDSRFAAGIVEGLNKHNLLNADAAKILLS